MFRYMPASVELEQKRDRMTASRFLSRFAARLYELDQLAAPSGLRFSIECIIMNDGRHGAVPIRPALIAEPLYESKAFVVDHVCYPGVCQGWEVLNLIRAAENTNTIAAVRIIGREGVQSFWWIYEVADTTKGDPVEHAEVFVMNRRERGIMSGASCLLHEFEVYKFWQVGAVIRELSPPDRVCSKRPLPRKKNQSSRRYRKRRAAQVLRQWEFAPRPHVLLPDITRIVCSYVRLES